MIGAIWNFAKGTGSLNLVQNMGHKGPVLRPRCIGPGRARTQIPFYSIHLINGHKRPEGEQMYSSTLTLNLTLDGGG
jgi:hypothetical protein